MFLLSKKYSIPKQTLIINQPQLPISPEELAYIHKCPANVFSTHIYHTDTQEITLPEYQDLHK